MPPLDTNVRRQRQNAMSNLRHLFRGNDRKRISTGGNGLQSQFETFGPASVRLPRLLKKDAQLSQYADSHLFETQGSGAD